MKRVQSSSGVEFQSSAAVTKVSDHAAAKQTPEGEALPAAGLWRRPDAEGRSEEGAQQEQIERDAGDEACCEDEMSDIEVDHGARGKNQIRFANLRQDAEGSVALLDATA